MQLTLKYNPVFEPIFDLPLHNPAGVIRYVRLQGGAGSGKSIAAAQWVILAALEGHRVIAFRKVGNTVRLSLYQTLIDTLENMGFIDSVAVNKSEFSFTFPGGGMIFCKGLDKADKIMSVQNPTIIWMEEASQFDYADFLKLDTRLRYEGKPLYIILTYNPVDVRNWIRKLFEVENFQRHKCLYIHSTYLDNLFLPDSYPEMLESLQLTNANFHQVYARGEWGQVLTGLVFPHYKIVPTFPEVKLNQAVYGLDWGWNDPTAIVRAVLLDKTELYLQQVMYRSQADMLTVRLALEADGATRGSRIYCDHRPDSIDQLRKYFPLAQNANKAHGIVSGIRYMNGLNMYVVAPSAELVKELDEYKFPTDIIGRVVSDTPEGDDHAIDAARYAVMSHFASNVGSGGQTFSARPAVRRYKGM